MSIFAKYNKTNVNFDIDVKGMEFTKLKDLYPNGTRYTVNGLYIHTGKLNVHPVAISQEINRQIDLPEHLTDTVRSILADSEAVEAIREGKCAIEIYEYTARNKQCYSVRFVEND